MSKGLEELFGTLRKAAAVQLLGTLSDRVLVERFLSGQDEAAFTVLIERPGPMVFDVCRRSLANRHDAEDACQATFLVLASKVTSLKKRESIGSWLHGIACRVASNLKRHSARRRRYEQRINPNSALDPAIEASTRETQACLDEELRKLPEEFRAPLILCYLERLPRERAASALGLTSGSLRRRLERA